LIGHEKSRKVLGQRNGLKIYARLQTKTKLKTETPLKFKSEKQKELDDLWSEITDQKIKITGNRCEWCGRLGQRTGTANFLSGHHIIKRSHGRIDTLENCFVAHWISCHQFIEQNGIDVRKYKNKTEWEKRNEPK
jgi:hypothetical protein